MRSYQQLTVFARWMSVPVVALTLLYGCRPKGNGDAKPAEVRFGNITVADTSLYSRPFIQSLIAANFSDSIWLKGDTMYIGGEFVQLPMTWAAGRDYRFESMAGDYRVQLRMSRHSLSSVNYDLELVNEETSVRRRQSGIAHLNPGFFLAAEIDEDDSTGEAYGAAAYEDLSGECPVRIWISLDPDPAGHWRVRVWPDCPDAAGWPPVEAWPLLRSTGS